MTRRRVREQDSGSRRAWPSVRTHRSIDTGSPSSPEVVIRLVAAFVVVTLTCGALAAPPSSAAPVTRTPDNARYVVALSTASAGRAWSGTQSVTFENTGSTALGEVWLRLWANGRTGCTDPGVVVSNVTGATAADPAARCTALELTLPQPLAPGATATVSMELEIRPPPANDRFGWWGRTARLGNALPILAVHDDEGWHLEPYYAFGESFYSLVSDWTVTLDVPAGLETPATGVLTAVVAEERGREARTFLAEDVRDFAWEAGQLERVRTRDERDVRVALWYPAGVLSARRAARMVRRAAAMMDTFSSAFGAYPYEEIDVVVASFDTFGGMEYPQLVLAIPSPLVISHELAHQWWYGIVGNDEYEDPWIDEGFAQWSMYLPFRGDWPRLPLVGCAMFPWPSEEVRLSSGVDYFEAHPEDYFVPYEQGACALARLAKLFGGLRPFLDVLRAYAGSHWLGVSTNAEVMAALEAAAADAGLAFDPRRFFDRWRISRAALGPGAR